MFQTFPPLLLDAVLEVALHAEVKSTELWCGMSYVPLHTQWKCAAIVQYLISMASFQIVTATWTSASTGKCQFVL